MVYQICFKFEGLWFWASTEILLLLFNKTYLYLKARFVWAGSFLFNSYPPLSALEEQIFEKNAIWGIE